MEKIKSEFLSLVVGGIKSIQLKNEKWIVVGNDVPTYNSEEDAKDYLKKAAEKHQLKVTIVQLSNEKWIIYSKFFKFFDTEEVSNECIANIKSLRATTN